MKNDLQNMALAQEQYFQEHNKYVHPDSTFISTDYMSYSDDIFTDSTDIDSSQDWWYARLQHDQTDIKCELLFRSKDEVTGIVQKIVCPLPRPMGEKLYLRNWIRPGGAAGMV